MLSKEWSKLRFKEIQAEELQATTENYVKAVIKCEKGLPENKVINFLKKLVWEFKNTIPVVISLRSTFLGTDHWTEIKKLVKGEFKLDDPNFTL